MKNITDIHWFIPPMLGLGLTVVSVIDGDHHYFKGTCNESI